MIVLLFTDISPSIYYQAYPLQFALVECNTILFSILPSRKQFCHAYIMHICTYDVFGFICLVIKLWFYFIKCSVVTTAVRMLCLAIVFLLLHFSCVYFCVAVLLLSLLQVSIIQCWNKLSKPFYLPFKLFLYTTIICYTEFFMLLCISLIGFVKRGLPPTSNSVHLGDHNLVFK